MPSEKAAFVSQSNELNSLPAKFYKTIFAVGSDKVCFSQGKAKSLCDLCIRCSRIHSLFIVSTGSAGRAGVFGLSRKHSFHFMFHGRQLR